MHLGSDAVDIHLQLQLSAILDNPAANDRRVRGMARHCERPGCSIRVVVQRNVTTVTMQFAKLFNFGQRFKKLPGLGAMSST